MIAVQAQIIWGANLIPSGAACGGDEPRRKPTCSRMPANCMCDGEGSDDGTLATPGGGVGSCGVDVRPPSDWEISSKKPATDCSVRALQLSRCWRYAGDLPDMSNRFRAVNKLRKIRRNDFDKLKPLWPIVL
ncbi:hypothetical protein V1283_000811 [Bradyrhizobium sp. AZCC 2262]|jgi:hypothetical protein|uniref:hypothetical protein n=1 Tax=Bradyrhizobium sp. AZCC 2262 TaxID=3117022 RepID=UPI002FF418C9